MGSMSYVMSVNSTLPTPSTHRIPSKEPNKFLGSRAHAWLPPLRYLLVLYAAVQICPDSRPQSPDSSGSWLSNQMEWHIAHQGTFLGRLPLLPGMKSDDVTWSFVPYGPIYLQLQLALTYWYIGTGSRWRRLFGKDIIGQYSQWHAWCRESSNNKRASTKETALVSCQQCHSLIWTRCSTNNTTRILILNSLPCVCNHAIVIPFLPFFVGDFSIFVWKLVASCLK